MIENQIIEERKIVERLNAIPFEHVISLGFFCSVAKDIESLGLRNGTGPIDWCWSTWGGCIQLHEK